MSVYDEVPWIFSPERWWEHHAAFLLTQQTRIIIMQKNVVLLIAESFSLSDEEDLGCTHPLASWAFDENKERNFVIIIPVITWSCSLTLN